MESVHQLLSTQSWFKNALLCFSEFSSLFLGFCHLFLLLSFQEYFLSYYYKTEIIIFIIIFIILL